MQYSAREATPRDMSTVNPDGPPHSRGVVPIGADIQIIGAVVSAYVVVRLVSLSRHEKTEGWLSIVALLVALGALIGGIVILFGSC